jgi:endonuclease/exonuclease/phosphatase family metal-dependent hydrolase
MIAAIALVAAAQSSAHAQTTVTISAPQTQVVFATLRSGSYANTNIPNLLETRAADPASNYLRRALLKFDTQNTIPKGASVSAAYLTVTVKDGSEDASRRIAAYQVTNSWTETETTWNNRRDGQAWINRGGDLGTLLATATVGNAAGTRVTFNVTSLVRAAVSGSLGTSRYTRIALVDLDGATHESYRAYYTPADGSTYRPSLSVTYGSSTSTTTTTSTSSTTRLRVLHWNTHHNGVGTDGKLDPNRLMTWVAKINPDIVSMNEVEMYTSWGNFNGPVVLRDLLQQKTGRTWYYKFQTASGSSKGNGNLILSRFPFNTTATRLLSYTRSIVNASITVNGRTVNFFSTHLDDNSTSERLTEIGELTSWASGMSEQRIIGGDFNAWPGSTENATMKQTYKDSWAVAQAQGTAIAYPGNDAGNTRSSRIDYIYYSENASRLTLRSSQVFDTRDANGVMPSDHRPLLSIFDVN